ncbi:RAMP superfamily CRISPR-associated protein [Oceanivirga salmonicida]|uniref:RAMP superfamily CRISPR-associated protein n=1 Tax=Oceanivirga salmonicida TaxID=1769291 RepID=UPI0018CC4F01|nr:RAMP superfamily CRISPR-associated protein [Oceanivirga salmonicida]
MNKIEYKIILKSNFLTAETGIIGKDLDLALKRDYNGIPIIYGKHIKGILRERFTEYCKALEPENKNIQLRIDNLFGSSGQNISSIFFSNLKISEYDEKSISSRSSIRIDRKTKTTKESSLFNYEILSKGNEFLGDITIKKNISENDLKLILSSLYHLNKIGGLKSRGLGDVEIKIKYNDKYVGIENLDKIVNSFKLINNETKINIENKKYSFEVEFLSDAVFQSKKISNLIISRDNIQGSTIRGALINYGLEKGFDIKDLLDIKVVLKNDMKLLKSEFETKYKLGNTKKTIDKSIFPDKNEEEFENKSIKYQMKTSNEIKSKLNDVSIKINESTRCAENGMLFNYELLNVEENNIRNKYYGEMYIPSNFLINNEIELYIGKYKSKGFGKIKLKVISDKKSKISIEKRVEKYNKLIISNDKYITFDFITDCILPFNKVNNILKQFKKFIKLDILDEQENRSFISIKKLSGYNIINNIRKSDELIIEKGSVLSYKIPTEFDLKKLERLENGIGLRLKEGFGILEVCSETKYRGCDKL